MGKAPAVIIIARHGARLDAEDKRWHLTTTEPYNTPLTYGGWTQTRALGARIASLLHARSNESAKDDSPQDHSYSVGSAPAKSSADFGGRGGRQLSTKRRKHKIILHTSPYLRCIQSSIAICAGIAQYEGNLLRFERQEARPPSRSQPLYTPIRSKTLDTTSLEAKYGQPSRPGSSEGAKPQNESATAAILCSQPLLRVDAFLGEWQSPDYYENMTPPPASNMLVAGAKAELRKPAEPIQGSQFHESFPDHGSISAQGGQHGIEDVEKHPLSLNVLAKNLPGQNGSDQDSDDSLVQSVSSRKPRPVGYFPPTPTYAISTSTAIPEGYVAHARDAVLEIDFQWDSMREPQNWPDGGEYGEEWSAMHNRFRQGFIDMLNWYKEYGTRSALDVSEDDFDEDEESDLVLILVTHSAGCNALIGALTNQPVLLDVGMASLTMAVARDPNATQPRRESIALRRRRSVVDTASAEEFEVKLIASTDHLRAGGDLLKIPQLQTPPLSATRPDPKRNRGTSLSAALTPLQPPQENDRQQRSKNSSLGSIRRVRPTPTSSVGSFQGMQELASPLEAGTHLWDPRRSSVQSTQSIQEEEDVDPLTPERTITMADGLPGRPPRRNTGNIERRNTGNTENSNQSEDDVLGELPSPGGNALRERRPSQRGLWGAAAPQENRRRWTISDR